MVSGRSRITAVTMKTAPAYLFASTQSLTSESRDGPSGDGARRPEGIECGTVVAQHTAEDVVRVLPGRRHRPHPRRRLGELDRRARQVHLAGHGVLALDQHLAGPQ